MPTVPDYGGPRVAEAPLPNTRLTAEASPAAFGVPTGLDLSSVQRVAVDIWERERVKQNQVAALEADNKAQSIAQQLFLDPEQGALFRRGKEAIPAGDRAFADLDKGIGEISSSLANDEQRLQFQRLANSLRLSYRQRVSEHVAGELRAYDDEQVKQGTDKRVNNAIATDDPAERQRLLGEIRALYRDKARRDGVDPDVSEFTQAQIAQATSTIHVGAIQRMITAGNDAGAKAYFEQNRAGILGKSLAEIEQQVKVASTDGEGARAATAVWGEFGPKNPADPVKIATMEDEVRRRLGDNQPVIKAAIAELRTRREAHNAQQAEMTAANKAAVLGAYNQGTPLAKLKLMPEYLALDGGDQEEIVQHVVDRGYALQQRAFAENPSPKQYATYWEMSEPKALAAMSENQILALQPRIGLKLTNDLMERKRAFKPPRDIGEAKVDEDLFNGIAENAGLHPYKDKKTDEEKARLGRLRNGVEGEIFLQQQAKGRSLTREEKAEVMQRVVDKAVMLDVFGRDPQRIAATLSPEERRRAYVPVARIPVADREKIRAALRRAGKPVSDNKVERAYGAFLADDRVAFDAVMGE